MDFEERQQQKKRRLIRVIITEIIMFLAVILIVVVALLITMGFFVTSDGRIEQSGLIQIHSIPTGATVTIDDKTIFSRTNLSRTLSAGNHHIKLTRDGYDSWEKTIKMYSGLLVRLYYPRLFLENRTPESMLRLGENLEFYSTSSDRNNILYANNDSPTWHLVNVASDEVKTTDLDLTDILPGVADQKFLGELKQLTWNSSGDQVLTQIAYDNQTEWILVNLKDVKNSLNLTKTFGFQFDQVELVNDNTSQLFVLENHHLRRIDVSNQAISRVLLDNIESFTSQGSNLLYLTTLQTTDETSYRAIGTYRDGESGGTIITKITSDGPILIAISRYYDNDYLAYIINNDLTVYYGSIPTYSENPSDSFTDLEILVDSAQLTEIPDSLTVSPDGEYLLAQKAQSISAIDLEMGDIYAYDASTSEFTWIDSSMLYSTTANELQVWDFDGTNIRTLVSSQSTVNQSTAENTDSTTENTDSTIENSSTLPAVTTRSLAPVANRPALITSNNKWLYYVTINETGYQLVREKIW